MRLTLPVQGPFSFRAAVGSHGWFQLDPFAWDESASLLSYVMRLADGRVLDLRLRAADGGLLIETDAKLAAAERKPVREAVAWMFGLELDLAPFYAAVRHEPKLAHVERNGGGRVLRSPTFFEDVLKTILTTNTLWAATKRMNSNLIAQFGEPLPADGPRHAFPTPERLAASSEAELRERTRLGYRAPSVLELARRAASGDLDLEAFKTSTLPTIELRKELMKIRGIGPYAAANLLMLLGRSDFIPIDSWALKMVSREWHGGEPVTPQDVEAAFAPWGEWKGMAYWFWDWSEKDWEGLSL
jgi:3-methyladenine DNA glycosylase/8-oxoguanine DNA glycosylase